MARNRNSRFAAFVAVLVAVFVSTVALPQDSRLVEEREHAAAWAAHHICSGLFVVGRDLQRDSETVIAQDIAPFPAFRWEDTFLYEVDWEKRSVTVTAPGAPPRTATYYGDQGSIIHERDSREIHFTPIEVPTILPDPKGQRWPTGDLDAHGPLPPGADTRAFNAALDRAMDAGQNTRALVVIQGGKIIGERYAQGFTAHTPQISWSEGKSITAALVGILVGQGELEIDQPAPVPEWHRDPADPRGAITVRNLLNMSSGLDFKNYGVADSLSFTSENEHFMIYFDSVNVFEHAVNQPMDIPPNTQFRYRNSDPLTLGRIIRQTVEARGEDYLTFPRRALFDRIGMRDVVLETDTYGNFIMTGYDYVSAYDWARFGLLHLWDGVWDGERILPEGWVEFISTPTSTDRSNGYGGLFWLNGGGALRDIPRDAFWPAGFMGQNTVIIPSLDMVVVRQGPSPGGSNRYLNQVIGQIIEALAVPAEKSNQVNPYEEFGITANNAFFYYDDLQEATQFYTRTLGLDVIADYGFAKIMHVAPTSYLTLVDGTMGMHTPDEPKTVAIALITDQLDEWYDYLVEQGVEMRFGYDPVDGRPHHGFVAYDPEGYYLEFERFNVHPENEKLIPLLEQTETLYPRTGQETTVPPGLGFKATILWMYYRDTEGIRGFYEEKLGLDLTVDQGWAWIYQTSPSGYIGPVDETRGMHSFTEQKAVTASFFTDDLEGWFSYVKESEAFELRHTEISVDDEGRFHAFVGYDPGGYFLEFDTFLEHELNERLMKALGK